MQLVIIFVRVVVEEMAGQLIFGSFFAHQEDKAIKDRKNVRLPNKRRFNY